MMESNKRKRILICIPEMPYPIRRNGVSIRYLPILEHFSKVHDIDLMLLLEEEADQGHLRDLQKYCKSLYCHVQKRSKPGILKRIFVNLLSYIPGQQPLEIYNYDYPEIKSFVLSKTQGIHYDVKLSVVIAFAELLRDNVSADRFVIDCVDARYAHMLRVSDDTLISRYKLSLMRRWETGCISTADVVSFVSPMDVDVLYGDNEKGVNIEIIPNGIYNDDYTDTKELIEGFVIGFLGNMDYHPNIKAALKLAKIFKSLKKEISALKLIIIGRNPAQEVVALKKVTDIIVTGSVQTIWPYVNATDIFVFPMSFGAGLQNKLLDVMYASRPVISSHLGNSGVGARDGCEIELADTDEDIKAKIIELYKDADKRTLLGRSGNEFIRKKYEWNAVFKQIEASYFNY